MFVADCHCDTLTYLKDNNEELYKNSGGVSIEHLMKYEKALQVFAMFLDEGLLNKPFQNTTDIIKFFNSQVKKYNNYISLVKRYDDVLQNSENKKISALLAVEGGEAIEGSLEKLEILYHLGVRLLTLTWNRANLLADGIGADNGKGLTPFGKNVVKKMNSIGMIVDVSHLSVRGFWDVCEISNKPFIASHSNCKAVCDHRRNLSKEQIKAISCINGFIGINLYSPFLVNGEKATIDHVITHIDYILNSVGDECVGLGSDFDGADSFPEELINIGCYDNLYNKLLIIYGEETSNKIIGKNFLRILKEILL